MNPLRLLVLLVSLPLLLGGCGVEEPELEGVKEEELERRGEFPNFIYFIKGSDTPYTGKSYGLYKNGQKWAETNFKDGKKHGLDVLWHGNGQKMAEVNFKDGKRDGLSVAWHENGQKLFEVNFKDGKRISAKYWNSKGEPVDTWQEAK